MKSILILGGTGFIGFHLAKNCLKKNWLVTSISSKKPLKIRKLKRVKYIICDITNFQKLKKKIKTKKFDYVVNLSGYVDHKNKVKTYNSHFIGVKNLFNVLKKKKIKKFLQAGSSNEYGAAVSPQGENNICKPKTIYGKAKFLASQFLLEQYEKNNFPVTIFRFYQIYGPFQDNNRFIPQLINSSLKKFFFKTSSGNQQRDFLYIDDAINAIMKALLNKESSGKIFNIGVGKPIKLKKIMTLVKKKTNYFNPIFGKIKLRKDENKIVYPKVILAKRHLKWKFKTTFEQGLNKTIKFYRG